MPRLGPVLEYARPKIATFISMNEAEMQDGWEGDASFVNKLNAYKKMLGAIDAVNERAAH